MLSRKNNITRQIRVLCGVLLLASVGSHAWAIDEDSVKFHGFATVGLTKSNEDAFYLRDTRDDLSFAEDTVFGLQMSADITDDLVVQAQFLANGSRDAGISFDVELDWIFAAYQVNENFTVRAGKIRLPIMMDSEYFEAGYSYTAIRPSAELYTSVPFNSLTGVDLLISIPVGEDMKLNIQPFVGNVSDKAFVAGMVIDVQLTDLSGMKVLFGNDDSAVYVGTFTTDVAIPDFFIQDMDVEVYTFGYKFDWADIVSQGEYIKLDIPAAYGLSSSESWYVMAGYRFGDALVHLTVTERENEILAFANNLGGDQESTTLGVRYELADTAALKVEYQIVEPQNGTRGLFQTVPIEDKINIISVAVDFIF